jgi:ribosomal protein S18 acetylase RimI-like enzyme
MMLPVTGSTPIAVQVAGRPLPPPPPEVGAGATPGAMLVTALLMSLATAGPAEAPTLSAARPPAMAGRDRFIGSLRSWDRDTVLGVGGGPADVYFAGFVARCDFLRRPDQVQVSEPGVHGLLPSEDAPFMRLLVTDDRAHDAIAPLLSDARRGMVTILAEAQRCLELIDRHPAWTRSETSTAMVHRDLKAAPTLALPPELSVCPVRRLAGDPDDGVPLEQAVAAAKRADPRSKSSAAEFADYLRSLPFTVRLFAAVDAAGAVRATSGCFTFGRAASVFFVNTDSDWRRRGIGQAMTALALRAARDSGARHASLDATGAGARIYERLGFEAVSEATRFTPETT